MSADLSEGGGMAIKIGDTVHVRALVESVDVDGNPRVTVRNTPIWFDRQDIVHVEPRPLAVGDKVRVAESVGIWSIVHAGDTLAWIHCDGTNRLCPLHHLRRIP